MPDPSGTPEFIGSGVHTLDRRVRVFISSMIEELAAERAAARRAVKQLRQTPVYFESNAPHIPHAACTAS